MVSLPHLFKGWVNIFDKFVLGVIRTGDLPIFNPNALNSRTETDVKYASIVQLWYEYDLCWHLANEI